MPAPLNCIFQSTHPVRGATYFLLFLCSSRAFQSTHPVRGATRTLFLPPPPLAISIHAPRAGCDGMCVRFPETVTGFQSTHPVRGATIELLLTYKSKYISIHAPRAGCDALHVLHDERAPTFQSTHPVRGATSVLGKYLHPIVFQSTHPVRGATRSASAGFGKWLYFNPRTPCGVRRVVQTSLALNYSISIHAPRAGCDTCSYWLLMRLRLFQSTHPVRGATGNGGDTLDQRIFQSTHPVRGATRSGAVRAACTKDFNPRTPCGVRHLHPML